MSIFRRSAGEFRNIRSLVGAALLIALHTVFACFISIQVTDSLRISVSFVINVAIGAMYGPVMGFFCGGVGDIVQFLIKPTGPYFAGWTISAALAGFIYGLFFYNRTPMEVIPKELSKKTDRLIKIITVLIQVVVIILWQEVPIISVGGNNLSGKGTIKNALLTGDEKNAAIISAIILVMAGAICILAFFDKFKTSFLVGIVGTFAAILAAYTDKKTIGMLAGFWTITGCMIISLIILIYAVSVKNTLDLKFLCLTTLALTLDTLLINILLGTYWVTVMYGKGFAFYFASRLIKNMVQLPINIMLAYYFLGVVKRIKTKVK